MAEVGAVLLAALFAQLSAAVVGVLPWPVLPVSIALLVLSVRFGLAADERRAVLLRRAASAAAFAVLLAGLPGMLRIREPQQIKESLGLLLVGVQICQAVGWRAPRELRSGLFTAVGLLILAASYAPDVLVGIPLLLGWVAVLVGLGQLHGSRWHQLLPAVAMAVVLGLVAFLLVPAPVSAGIRSRLAGGPLAATTRADGGALAFSGGVLDLRRRGGLSDTPVLQVPADSPTLWRSTTFDVYDGSSWSRPEASPVPVVGPTLTVAEPLGPTRTDRARWRSGSDGTVFAPGRLDSVTAFGTGTPQVNELGDVLLPGLSGSYEVTSDEPVTDPTVLRSRRGADAAEVRWRSLPVALPDRVTDLARRLTAGAGSRWDAAEAIAAWLREHATYRLDSPVPQPGQDAVDRFLFVDRTGFCEQFASAEAVLLRSVGIPARLVTGLAYGSPEGNHRLYRERDLHAWVEFYVPGAGWVTSDPTAGVPLATGAAAGASLRTRVAGQLTSGLRALTHVPGGRPALALALLVASGLAALSLRRRPGRAVARPAAAATGPALAAFLRLDARLGAQRRRPGESLRELRSRLDPTLGEALGVVEQECYAADTPDPRAAVEVLDRYGY